MGIATIGSDRFVNFGGSGGGSIGGSIDFRIGLSGPILTFEPGFGPRYQATGASGTFQGIAATAPAATPEPATVLGLLSIAGVGLLSKRQKQ